MSKQVFLEGFDYLSADMTTAQVFNFLNADNWTGGVNNYMYPRAGTLGGIMMRMDSFSNFNTNTQFKALRQLYNHGVVFGERLITNVGIGSVTMGFGAYNTTTNTYAYQVLFTGFGVVKIAAGGKNYTSVSFAFIDNTAMYISFKYTADILELRINGDIIIQDLNPGPITPFDTLTWSETGTPAAFISQYVDDIYAIALDEGDNGQDVPYLGNIRVGAQAMIANGDVDEFDPVGVSFNYQAANNILLDTTKYNQTDVVGEYDLYKPNPGVAARQLFGISVKGFYTQDNGVQLWAKNQIKVGGNLYPGFERGANQLGYRAQDDLWEVNPATGVAWTVNDLNNDLQLGPLLSRSE